MDSSDTDDGSPVACPRCGATLPPDAPAELCPRCLMAVNLETETLASGDSPAASRPAPDIESLREHFPQLEIRECLGRGGMGVVYRAMQKSLNRPVALKLLDPERAGDPGFADRFRKEAHALAALNHPNIVTIYDHGEAGGYYFLTMEFVDGVNLRQAMSAGRFTPKEALAIVPPVCEALQYAHDNGIVHRDIKPENLLLDKDGRVKIADFGVAKILGQSESGVASADADDDASDSITGGTPRYMAPEQMNDPGHVDHRADIYAMGVVLYELLTGETPKGEITPPSKRVEVDVRIDEIVLRALEKEPALRYPTAADFRTRVEILAAQGSDPTVPQVRKSRLVHIVEIFFRTRFTSPAAIRLVNFSALGFLGFLGALGYISEPESNWLFGLSGFFGFFGLIGAAFLVETLSRRRGGQSPGLTPGGAWAWSALAIPLTGLAIFAFGILLAEGLEEFQVDANAAIFILAAIASVAAGLLILLRTVRTLRSAGENRRVVLAPPWLGAAGLILAGLSVLLGAAAFLQPGPARILKVLIPVCAVLGLGSGILARKNAISWTAIIVGGANLLIGFVFATVWAPNAALVGRGNGIEYPEAAHISRGGHSVMVHHSGDDLDYAIYYKGDFGSSSDSSQNRHSLSWIENWSVRLRESGQSFGYLRESVSPLFLRINGTEYDLREGRVFVLEDAGGVEQLAIFPPLAKARLPEAFPYFINPPLVPDWVLGPKRTLILDADVLSEGVFFDFDAESISRRKQASGSDLGYEDGGWQTWALQVVPIDEAALDSPARELIGWLNGTDWPSEGAPESESLNAEAGLWTFRSRDSALGFFEIKANPDALGGKLLEYRRLEPDLETQSAQPASAKIQSFAPTPGFEGKSHWGVMEKASPFNPDGWAVVAHLSLGGTASPKLPGESEPIHLKLVKGDAEAVTVEIRDKLREQTMTFDLVRDRPAQMTLNGKGFWLYFPTNTVAPDAPETRPFAMIIVKPAEAFLEDAR